MSLNSTFLASWLLGLNILLIVPRAASGQVPASDSTTPAAPDSQPPLIDSLQQTRPDSASGADSTRATSDTVRPPSGTATKSDTATTPTTPGDSLLSAACRGPAGPATVARNLLVVAFVPEAGGAERAAAAKSVGGTLLGRVTSGGASTYYLRVPSGGEEYRLRVAADQLIQLDMVRQVGSRACPPPSQ